MNNKRYFMAGYTLTGAALTFTAVWMLTGAGALNPLNLFVAALSAAAAAVLFVKESRLVMRLTVFAMSVQTLYALVMFFAPFIRIAREGKPPEAVSFLMVFAFAANFTGLYTAMRFSKISAGYLILYPMSVVWLFPIFWILMTSFRADKGTHSSYVIPRNFTLDNYIQLLTDTSEFQFARWFSNTLIVAVCSCLLTSFIVLATAFTLSRLRFGGRKPFMNVLLILGMFPGFMSMIAVYYILKGLNLTQSLAALVLVYSGGGALTYYVAKGFFDTIPASLDEAALLDGATKWQLFTRITVPLSKPIIVYTLLISFISPWGDIIFSQIIMGDKRENYTIALGLFTMLEPQYINRWFMGFCAGAVLISIPITVLFMSLQKYYVEGLSGSVKG